MKKTDFLKEHKTLEVGELHNRARALAEELMKLRFRKATNQLERSHQIRSVKRNLARVQTLITAARKTGKKAK